MSISVVIPAYNAETYLAETLDSILAQTYQQFEIIVVDDGSTDNTVKIVKEYANKDSRVTLIQNDHGRQSKARNTAIAASKYEWIAPVDSDDILLPNRFQCQLEEAAKHPEVVAWASFAERVTADGHPYRRLESPPTTMEKYREMQANHDLIFIPNSTCLIKKSVIEKIGGYDARFDGVEDLELLDRVAAEGPVLVIPEVLLHYRMYDDSSTAAYDKYVAQRKLFRFLFKRRKERQNGRDIDIDTYLETYDNISSVRRFLRHLDTLSGFHHRVAALQFGEKKYMPALKSLILSTIYNPWFTVHGVLKRLRRG
ncbi:MAG: glycosyltransferase [Anaerolineae bacterium]|nr:glycosyltransferase [Anaerolineae bacterium]MCA9889535.1 glycosyltransferase [Anaerolineae bacterium]MCA9893149.1 glycosyltransferase [Anaerolineae bacterium]